MKGAILDWDSLKGGELNTSELDNLPVEWMIYSGISQQELEQIISEYDILVTNKVVLDRVLFERATNLKLVCVAATGTNNVDLDAASEKKIPVCNITAYANDSVAQHTFMLMFLLLRQFIPYRNDVNQGAWHKSPFFCLLDHPIQSVRDKTLGIIGYGELGRSVASIARNFGMNVIVSESLQDKIVKDTERVSFDSLLQDADVISLHCPLSNETKNLIDLEALKKMKPTAILLNTARGGIVNEADLLTALEQKIIAGAALDVLETEPPTHDHPLLTAKLDNLIVTPHIAWASIEARQKLLNGIISNIQNWLKGQTQNQVNP